MSGAQLQLGVSELSCLVKQPASPKWKELNFASLPTANKALTCPLGTSNLEGISPNVRLFSLTEGAPPENSMAVYGPWAGGGGGGEWRLWVQWGHSRGTRGRLLPSTPDKEEECRLAEQPGGSGPGLQFPSETAIHWLSPNTPGSTAPLHPPPGMGLGCCQVGTLSLLDQAWKKFTLGPLEDPESSAQGLPKETAQHSHLALERRHPPLGFAQHSPASHPLPGIIINNSPFHPPKFQPRLATIIKDFSLTNGAQLILSWTATTMNSHFRPMNSLENSRHHRRTDKRDAVYPHKGRLSDHPKECSTSTCHKDKPQKCAKRKARCKNPHTIQFHRLYGHEFEHTPGDSEGQETLVCCSPWSAKSRTQLSKYKNTSIQLQA